MSLSINSNIGSLNAQTRLNKASSALGTSFKRLSSGLRVNSSKDDSAGMSISNRMTSQIRGLNQAVRNVNDSVSMVQVAEGALDETTNALQRMRELAVQASNDTLVTSDREDIWKEMAQLQEEVDRIATQTTYNGQNVLGSTTQNTAFSATLQIGNNANQTFDLTINAAYGSNLGVGQQSIYATTASFTALDASEQHSLANEMIGKLDSALDSVSDIRADLGSVQNRLESVMTNLTNVAENTADARSRIMDTDIAAETSNLTRNSILQQAATAILAQANQQPQIALQLLG
ncbi:flagellin N-terminal helical domain-containing protein [Magnetococcales bacterium HHB-1]